MFRSLYTAFVRSHLEYAQAALSPSSKNLVNQIEQVQMRVTKVVDGLADLDYPERLRFLKLPTLIYRRHRGDMLGIWKHFGIYERDILPISFRPLDRPSRQHNRQLFRHRLVDGVYGLQRNSFYYRTVNICNGHPAESLNVF
ncbi:hypothetical protein Pcinc_019770 [Petrolisthes cinctipes]|uniref:Uncharacterized protein n=1 Tax=Petrolisthes cinctipes TaxID=88211 RepID=A0AAE1FKW7_PETCI|nr:hypothetical protein Pcinc_019770 [Petrolisthes cinctipes]